MLEVIQKIAQKFTNIYRVFPKEEKLKGKNLNWKRAEVIQEASATERMKVYQEISNNKFESITILEKEVPPEKQNWSKEIEGDLTKKKDIDFRKTFF